MQVVSLANCRDYCIPRCIVGKDSCHQEANGAVTTPTNSSTGANGDPVRKGEEPQEEATPQSPRMSPPSVDVSEQVTTSMKLVGPFLCELLLEHKVVLTKVLVAADNRPLLSDSESILYAYGEGEMVYGCGLVCVLFVNSCAEVGRVWIYS